MNRGDRGEAECDMTVQTLEAVFENGVFRPLNTRDIAIPEGQQVRLIVEAVEAPSESLALATQVYDGLSEEQIEEIEKIILNRRPFFADRVLP